MKYYNVIDGQIETGKHNANGVGLYNQNAEAPLFARYYPDEMAVYEIIQEGTEQTADAVIRYGRKGRMLYTPFEIYTKARNFFIKNDICIIAYDKKDVNGEPYLQYTTITTPEQLLQNATLQHKKGKGDGTYSLMPADKTTLQQHATNIQGDCVEQAGYIYNNVGLGVGLAYPDYTLVYEIYKNNKLAQNNAGKALEIAFKLLAGYDADKRMPTPKGSIDIVYNNCHIELKSKINFSVNSKSNANGYFTL